MFGPPFVNFALPLSLLLVSLLNDGVYALGAGRMASVQWKIRQAAEIGLVVDGVEQDSPLAAYNRFAAQATSSPSESIVAETISVCLIADFKILMTHCLPLRSCQSTISTVILVHLRTDFGWLNPDISLGDQCSVGLIH